MFLDLSSQWIWLDFILHFLCVVQETGPSYFFTEEAPSQRNTEYILYSLSPLGLRKNVL